MTPPAEPVDVCIVVEGCYPYVAGGVSSWLDWLIRKQPDLSFGVVAVTADDRPREPKYRLAPNVRFLQRLALAPDEHGEAEPRPILDPEPLAELLCHILRDGDAAAFAGLLALAGRPVRRGSPLSRRAPAPPTRADFIHSRPAWQALTRSYDRLAPQASFTDFFWAWQSLVGGLMSVVFAPLPRARCYHAISTGYAGLYAARAALATGRPCAITEHGIYTNERRIDLVMADWITDRIDSGLLGLDQRMDVRDFWIRSFESYASIAYAASSRITTLYGANQTLQRPMGARDEQMEVIPNGIEIERFGTLGRLPHPRPTVALIGRVVPIKDIEAFIAAAPVILTAVPEAEILILGPMDEDPDYFDLCRRRIAELGLEEAIRFTGKVDLRDYLPRIDLIVLTSISEAQPLVLLEAGAAGIPCVTTDVGSCREIVEGAPEESPNFGIAGRVVPPMDSQAIGAAVAELLADAGERARCGAVLRRRVETAFLSETSAARYRTLYERLCTP
uniref:Uncharacterized ABC-type transport system permease components-like protein n=1 Tax=Cereibacter sphaeroides (strain ATCC 17025 / ATH 2.4.3) TaxID=349102 RepID=A4WZW4_CERS5